MDEVDVLIIGAGLAGLACAQALMAGGKRVKVLERSPRVGGRCASKAIGTGPRVADFGPVLIHGDDPDFLAWAAGLGDALVPGWPRRIQGSGTPCQPAAFETNQTRFALVPGIRHLAETLAKGIDVVTDCQIAALTWDKGVAAITADGRRFHGRHGVVATALEQTRQLLSTMYDGPGGDIIRSTDALLGQFSSLPCLAVIAEYDSGCPAPGWDILYPQDSRLLLLVSNEGSKRGLAAGQGPLLVLQARPQWSAEHLEADREEWTKIMLAEAAGLLGDWAGTPTVFGNHRWKYGRLDSTAHLVQPMVLQRADSLARWGLAGDLFDRDGGLQGAWRSGRRLAGRLLVNP